MSKELFVSSTPHETKVAIVEDDQLAEIYFERENEYTLAGSIYKGRVSRVLPGMQSAFVDVGLERDAFLYVTDFLEEQADQQEEFDAIRPTGGDRSRERQDRHQAEAPAEAAGVMDVGAEEADGEEAEASQTSRPGEEREGGRRWRGRRRRRGRGRDRGDRPEQPVAEPGGTPNPLDTRELTPLGRDASPSLPGEVRSRDVSPALQGEVRSRDMSPTLPGEVRSRMPQSESRREPEPAREFRSEPRREEPRREERRPQPRYQPIILPGESISKYQRLRSAATEAAEAPPPAQQPTASVQASPEPEPIPPDSLPYAAAVEPEHPNTISEPDRYVADVHQEPMVIADTDFIAAADATPPDEELQEPVVASQRDETPSQIGGASPQAVFGGAGTLEQEEIEEEESDFGGIAEALEDAEFEELEEETYQQGGGDREPIAVGAELGQAVEDLIIEQTATGNYESEDEGEEADDEDDAEEFAESEEFLESQPIAAGAEQAEEHGGRAEVRASAGTAGFQQRTDRSGDRRPFRGRRGGRRMRGGRRNIPRGPQPMITDLLKEGQEILVQIAKEPMAKKGARITSHIALPGRFLVYMPTVEHMGVSRKIASEEERQRLKRILLSERDTAKGGFIVRTAAAGASEDDLRADIRFLINLWNEIRSRAEDMKAPALIYHDLNVVERILRDQVTQNFSQIWVDNEQEYERVLRFVSRFQPSLVKRVKLYTKDTPLFEQFNIQSEIDKALKSKVWLKSGGYIVINQTEALVAIDINTGKYVGKTARLEDTIVKTNVDAIQEIVRQVRLRDLGGIIIIDFIDMDERRNRQKVMQALEEALKKDRAPSKVLQFNDFGLVAITRKRVKQSLERTLGVQCQYCTGTGLVKSPTTICNEIYVEMRKMARSIDRSDVLLRVNPEVGKALKANGARWIVEMEELTGRTIILKSDPTLHQEQYDIQ